MVKLMRFITALCSKCSTWDLRVAINKPLKTKTNAEMVARTLLFE